MRIFEDLGERTTPAFASLDERVDLKRAFQRLIAKHPNLAQLGRALVDFITVQGITLQPKARRFVIRSSAWPRWLLRPQTHVVGQWNYPLIGWTQSPGSKGSRPRNLWNI